MANLKEVRTRIQSVKSTQQITKAMKMVAASKLRKAQDAILQLRPYVAKLNMIRDHVSGSLGGDHTSEYVVERDVEKVLIVVVTSDRGLCGAFNSNIIKAAVSLIEKEFQVQKDNNSLWIMPLGKRGLDFFSKRGYNIIDEFSLIFQDVSFNNVKKAAEFAMSGFAENRFDKVMIVYNEFKNVATQILCREQFLPILIEEDENPDGKKTDYIFEPSIEYIIEKMIPSMLKIQFYKAVLESNASEQGARMTAMDQASENAGELLKDLRLLYNRTRQAAITKEILEIVGGAEALENG